MPTVAAVNSLVAATGVCWLLFAEARHAIRPSDLVLSYLLASVICDSIWIFVPGPSIHSWSSYLTLYTLVSVILKALLLFVECQGRDLALLSQNHAISPEETAGLIRGTLFWWINPILGIGARRTFRVQDIPTLPLELSTKFRRQAIIQAWDRRGLFGMFI